MKYFLTITLQLSIVNSAMACHPYINKWSQGCAWHHSNHAPPQVDHDWYVEIIKVPDERDEAVQKLKALQK